MLFPTIRFAIFFAVVLPASWVLMPLPGRRDEDPVDDRAQPWLAPVALLGIASLLGPFAPADGWSGPVRALLWLLALAVAAVAVVRWLDLRGLVRWQVFILVASYVFYGAYDWHFVFLLAGSTIGNQVLANAIFRAPTDAARRGALAVAVVANVGLLAWFKYRGFFLESSQGLFEVVGIDVEPPGGRIVPPVGISFFTFCALSYVIDTYRGSIRPTALLDFAVYLAFFPHLVAGPIVRASEFVPQLRTPRDARRVDTGLAFWLIGAGLFKKVVVSSYLETAVVFDVFRQPDQYGPLEVLLGIYGYAIQIYCDFSGYTDMAIGLALLLGFRFPQNFDAPYTAASLQEFWRRWHMTLSRWLRDYLYIPLGGNQRGPSRAYVNLFLTMLIGGLWHGAAWTFVVWGALHGGWLALERWWTGRPRRADAEAEVPDAHHAMGDLDPADDLDPGGAPVSDLEHVDDGATVRTRRPAPAVAGPALSTLSPRARTWIGRLVTFHIVCIAWVFFRASTLTEAFDVLGRLFAFGTESTINWMVVATVVALLATQFVPAEVTGRAQAALSRLSMWQQALVLAAAITVTNALSPTLLSPFIYFAF